MNIERPQLTRRKFLRVIAGGALLVACDGDAPARHREDLSYLQPEFPPQNELTPLSIEKLHRPKPVFDAVVSLFSHQPEKTYFLTDLEKRTVNPMDVAHVAIALPKVEVPGINLVERAEAGVNWMLERITLPEDVKPTEIVDGIKTEVNYTGSWQSLYNEKGEKLLSPRGRGESVGLMLMAIDSISRADPTYLDRDVNGKKVHEYVSVMVDFIGTLQRQSGAFRHRPTYNVAFVEENVRMSRGLEYAAVMLKKIDEEKSIKAKDMADRGKVAISRGEGLAHGMSYDFIGESIWGMGGTSTAQKEMKKIRDPQFLGISLLNDSGVRVYDWEQEDRIKQVVNSFKQFPNGTSETAEAGIAALMAGELETAIKMENSLLQVQRDGGFPSMFVMINPPFYDNYPVRIGNNVVYSAARFILLDRAITEAKSRVSTPLQR